MDVAFFDSPSDLRSWFEQHHETARELWIGFYRKDSGRTGVTYAEALDQALCFGWIDGVRRRVDELSYTNRFTPIDSLRGSAAAPGAWSTSSASASSRSSA
jgi:uncharacterized protein YdeI (YjbR/CyaY-like superfamily)